MILEHRPKQVGDAVLQHKDERFSSGLVSHRKDATGLSAT